VPNNTNLRHLFELRDRASAAAAELDAASTALSDAQRVLGEAADTLAAVADYLDGEINREAAP